MKNMKTQKAKQAKNASTLRLLAAAFEAAAHSTVIADIEGHIVWVNAAFTRVTGYTAEEAIGKKTSLLKSGDQDAAYYKNLWETILAGDTWLGTLVNQRKDGTSYLERQAITPVPGESGKIEHFIAIKEDITEAVRTQEALRKSADRYRRLFDKSPLALWEEDYSAVKVYIDELQNSGVSDLRAYFDAHPEAVRSCASLIKVVEVNEAAIKLVGAASKEEVLGNLPKFFTDSSYDALKDQLVCLAAGNLFYETEADNMTLDGGQLSVKLNLRIAPEFSRCWSEVNISLEDISERKLREKQLANALKMEAVGQLTSGIAHDFNNVLTVISGNLRLLTEMSGHEMSEQTAEMMADVLSAADDGAQLTTRLLAFSRKPVADGDVADIKDAIVDFVGLIERTLGSGIQVEMKLDDDLGTMKTDASAFGNALLNLSLNARDAMQAGGRLTFTASNGFIEPGDLAGGFTVAEPIPCIIVEVTDTGIGMSANVLAKAIEPFFTTKELEDGSGLGLSVVHEFTRECGGDLRISSTVGRGTTVALYLPLLDIARR